MNWFNSVDAVLTYIYSSLYFKWGRQSTIFSSNQIKKMFVYFYLIIFNPFSLFSQISAVMVQLFFADADPNKQKHPSFFVHKYLNNNIYFKMFLVHYE